MELHVCLVFRALTELRCNLNYFDVACSPCGTSTDDFRLFSCNTRILTVHDRDRVDVFNMSFQLSCLSKTNNVCLLGNGKH